MTDDRLIKKLESVYNKYSNYNYIDEDLSDYHIKSIKEFNAARGGICWDFVGPIANDLERIGVQCKCYFTGIHVNGEMIASHTYIISDTSPRYWIECAWMIHRGVHRCTSYKCVESLLKREYNADEIYTLTYDPFEVYGKTTKQFFDYLEDNGVEL